MPESSPISPTAHYTGYVWYRNGLSHPELATTRGRIMFEAVRPWMLGVQVFGGSTLERYLLARHRLIDSLLEHAIEVDGVTQVIEIAAGLSARGWRLKQRFGERLVYVDADLPEMAAHKRRALERMGAARGYRVEEVDALRADGPGSLAALGDTLDRGQPVAVITEGLLGYLSRDEVLDLWRRLAGLLGGFRSGFYCADFQLAEDVSGPHVEAFRLLLSAFVRGQVRAHFSDVAETKEALRAAGFGRPLVHSGGDRANVLEAHV